MYRVMIVEDDDIIAGTVKKHLEQWQYDVHIAADLSNVMGEFTDYSPHIVLTVSYTHLTLPTKLVV